MQKVTPCLWFDGQAEEAARFYVSVFPNSAIGRITRYVKEGFEMHGQPEGRVMTVDFEIEGQRFLALNGGPQFRFTEAVSFVVRCETQEDVDYYWDRLGEGGDPAAQQCGWLKDRYGLSWQIAPDEVIDMFADPDTRRTGRVMNALLPMKKLDLAALRKAYAGT